MAYGKPKLSSTEIKAEILKEISDAIDRNSDFTADNLSFYGYSLSFEVNLILQARGPESAVNVIGSKSRSQQLEPGESPPLSRREFTEQWLSEQETKGADIDVDTLTDFIDHVPTDETEPETKLIRVKGKKAKGAVGKGN